jgi:hypothetical protein
MTKTNCIYKESKSFIPICNYQTHTFNKNTNNRMQHKYKVKSIWIKELKIERKCATCGDVTDIVAKNITLT